jgi:hypothetical protein
MLYKDHTSLGHVFFTVESMEVTHVLKAQLTPQSIHTCTADFVHVSAVIIMASLMVNTLHNLFGHHPVTSSLRNKAFYMSVNAAVNFYNCLASVTEK